jgi:23S rRNA pseudouridine2457 synthase
MGHYIAFYKPYEVLSQFTDARGRATLKDYVNLPGIYAAGRLDYRSEGLLLLTDDGELIHLLTDPRHDHPKTYLVQVEGICSPSNLDFPTNGIILPGLQSKAAHIEIISEPVLPPRSKPVRDYHPTTWLKVIIREGKKHQVRRMTAALGFPTLRLVRVAIGGLTLGGLGPGEWYSLSRRELERKVFG